MNRYVVLAICMAAVSLGGCGKESSLPTASGKGSIRMINAIPAAPSFALFVEETAIGQATYKSFTPPTRYDDLEYTFNFEVILAGDFVPTRVASQLLDVVKDKDYTFVLSGAVATPTVTLWESDEPDWSGSETTFEARFGNTSASIGNVDFYLADVSIPPAPGGELGTLAFAESTSPVQLESGEYVVTITVAGDPGMIRFQSDPITFIAQTSHIISVFDGDANDLTPWAVRNFNLSAGGSLVVPDKNVLPTVRFFNASLLPDNEDIYVDDPLTTPFVSNLAFGEFTGDLDIPAGPLPLTITTANSMGMVIHDLEETIIAGTHTHYYVVKTAIGDSLVIDHRPFRRSVSTLARISFMNTASSHPEADVYLVPTGEAIDEAAPFLPGIPVGFEPLQLVVLAGSFDIYVTPPGEKTILAGPVPIDIAFGDVIDTMLYENVDPNVVDIVFIPLP